MISIFRCTHAHHHFMLLVIANLTLEDPNAHFKAGQTRPHKGDNLSDPGNNEGGCSASLAEIGTLCLISGYIFSPTTKASCSSWGKAIPGLKHRGKNEVSQEYLQPIV